MLNLLELEMNSDLNDCICDDGSVTIIFLDRQPIRVNQRDSKVCIPIVSRFQEVLMKWGLLVRKTSRDTLCGQQAPESTLLPPDFIKRELRSQVLRSIPSLLCKLKALVSDLTISTF
jgi:hypothetical protein